MGVLSFSERQRILLAPTMVDGFEILHIFPTAGSSRQKVGWTERLQLTDRTGGGGLMASL